MVQVRKRAAVTYAEPPLDDADLDSEEEHELKEPEQVIARSKSPKPRAPRQPRKRRSDKLQEITAGDTALLSAVLDKSTALTITAKEWVGRYTDNRATAVAELLTLLLQGAGVTGRAYTAEEVEHSGADELRDIADAEAHENGIEDVAGTTRTAKHNFLSNYRELWDKILREAAATEKLYDDYLLEHILNFVVALSTSVVRPLRRIGSLIAMQISISLLHVTCVLEEARDVAQRQEATERRKQGKSAADRAAKFHETVEKCTSEMDELATYVNTIFTSVVTTRCRDIDPEIRAAVAEGISHWALLQPAKFLYSTYLKYPLMLLSDVDANVRNVAIHAVIRLYSVEGNASAMTDTTTRFKPRFLELIDDVDDQVAVSGVVLVTLLVRQGSLPANAAGQVYQLLGGSSAPLRMAAAELVAGMLKERGTEALQEADMLVAGGGGVVSPAGKKGAGGGRSKAGKKKGAAAGGSGSGGERTDAELRLAGILHVLRLLSSKHASAAAVQHKEDGDMEEDGNDGGAVLDEVVQRELDTKLAGIVVDALFEKARGCLDNWPLMLRWLSSDEAMDFGGDQGVAHLALVFLWGFRKASGKSMPGGDGLNPKEKLKGKAAREVAAANQEASGQLMNVLPTLLNKYQSNAPALTALISLIPDMRLELYALKNEERQLVELAKAVKNCMFNHGDSPLAQSSVLALVDCATHGPPGAKNEIRVVLNQAIDKALKALTTAVGKLENAGVSRVQRMVDTFNTTHGREEYNVLFKLRAALSHFAALQQFYPSGVASKSDTSTDAFTRVLELAASDSTALPAGIVLPAASSAFLDLAWRLHTLKQSITDITAAANENDENDGGEGNAAVVNVPDAGQVGELSQAVSLLGSQLEAVEGVASRKDDGKTAEGVAAVHADLMLLFSRGKLGTVLEDVAYEPPDAVMDAFWTGCERVLQQDGPGTPDVDVERHPHESEAAFQARVEAAEQRAHSIKTARKHTAEMVSQLVGHAAVPQWRNLAAQLVSYWETGGDEVGNVAKELMKQIKSHDANIIPAIHLDAMKTCYSRCKALQASKDLAKQHTINNTSDDSDNDDDDDDENAYLMEFVVLCEKIVHVQGSTASPAALAWVVAESAKYAISGGVDRLDFLHGAYLFMARLKGADAARALQAVEAAAAAANIPAEDEVDDEEEEEEVVEDWSLLHEYIKGLKERVSRGKSALKKTTTPGSGGGGGTRKISFADKAAAAAEDDDEEEEEEPVPKAAAAQKGSKRQKQQPAKGGRSTTTTTTRRAAAAKPAPVDESSDEEEEEEEEEDNGNGWGEEVHSDNDDDGNNNEEEDEFHDADGGDDDDGDDGKVMPTEEMIGGLGMAQNEYPENGDDEEEEEEEEVQHARRRRRR